MTKKDFPTNTAFEWSNTYMYLNVIFSRILVCLSMLVLNLTQMASSSPCMDVGHCHYSLWDFTWKDFLQIHTLLPTKDVQKFKSNSNIYKLVLMVYLSHSPCFHIKSSWDEEAKFVPPFWISRLLASIHGRFCRARFFPFPSGGRIVQLVEKPGPERAYSWLLVTEEGEVSSGRYKLRAKTKEDEEKKWRALNRPDWRRSGRRTTPRREEKKSSPSFRTGKPNHKDRNFESRDLVADPPRTLASSGLCCPVSASRPRNRDGVRFPEMENI